MPGRDKVARKGMFLREQVVQLQDLNLRLRGA